MASELEAALPLPRVRCLTKQQAAEYLGIGVTLLAEIGPEPLKMGRRSVYDVVDLDAWLEDYKQRGRAGKESQWPVKPDSTGEQVPVSGGSTLYYQTANDYEEALKPRAGRTRKRSWRS
jgi:hypothetical protein